MTLPEMVPEAGRSVLAADRDSLARSLGAFVSTFVGRPYIADPATLEGAGGRQSARFACVIFTAGEGAPAMPAGGPVPLTRAAAVIDACEELSLEELREAYARIAGAKRLRQEAPPPNAAERRSELLGVILAKRSPLNLEAIAEEMQRLNAGMPATLWPDMVAVADTGLVQYSEADFRGMLARFHRQSNMVVRPDETSWVVKKFADEGSSSPFMARLLLSLFKLRDAALAEGDPRDRFDKAYQAVTTPLLDARARMKKIAALWEGHARLVRAGEVAFVRGHAIHVDANVDHELGQEADAFLNAAARALKTGMQALALELGVNIGFLFQRQPAFDAGLGALAAQDPALAAYLEQARAQWSETLVNRRNAIEHEGWRLPDVTYVRAGSGVGANAPLVDGQAVAPYAAFMFDRLSCFVEEVTAHLLKRRLMDGVTITEVPRDQRVAEAPERFRVTLAIGGLTP